MAVLIALAMWLAVLSPIHAQNGQRTTPIADCYISGMSSATKLSASICASFTGTGSGNNLTVTSVSGFIQPGMTVLGTGVPAGTSVISQTSGTPGKAGVYVTSGPTTSSNNSLTTGGLPGFPNVWGMGGGGVVGYAAICSYVQGVVWKDDGGDPTATAGVGGQAISVNNCLPYYGNFQTFEAIQQTSGAVLSVFFYR